MYIVANEMYEHVVDKGNPCENEKLKLTFLVKTITASNKIGLMNQLNAGK